MVRLAVLLSPKQCDVDSVTDVLLLPADTTSRPLPSLLRLPPLVSLSSPLSAGVVDSSAVKHSAIVCVLSLLRTLLRVDKCIQLSTTRRREGRMIRASGAGERQSRGWIGGHRDEQEEESNDDSDMEFDIQP